MGTFNTTFFSQLPQGSAPLGGFAVYTSGAGVDGILPLGGNNGLPYNNAGVLAGTTLSNAMVIAAIGFTPGTVISVFGRGGVVVATAGDYTVAQVTGAAPIASPTFTGTPAAPTPSPGDSSTALATTAFVATSYAPLNSPVLTGTPTAPLAAGGTNTTQIATTSFVNTMMSDVFNRVYSRTDGTKNLEYLIGGNTTGITLTLATAQSTNQTLTLPNITAADTVATLGLNNAFTGTNTAPTAAPGTATTQLATTAFVNTSFAKLASPALTGTPTAPTAAGGTNTTQIATTAFVTAAVTGPANYVTNAQTFFPLTGGTVSPTDPGATFLIFNCFINPAGTLAALTLTLPTAALAGQIIYVTFTQIITVLTVTATNIGANGIASPTSATASSTFAWVWNTNIGNKWLRFL